MGAGVGEASASALGAGWCVSSRFWILGSKSWQPHQLSSHGRQLTLPALVFLPVSWAQSTTPVGCQRIQGEGIGIDYGKPSEVFSDSQLS